jgi:hypothetical protein
MGATLKLLLLIVLILSSVDAQENFLDPIFGNRIDLGLIEYDQINEASGIAASRKNPGVLWTHNDSGDPNRVFAFNNHGQHLGVYYIDGAGARDWEDMTVGPGPDSGKQYLYIGDIGDNIAQFDIKYIYRVPEPDVDSNQTPIVTTLYGTEVIAFKYPDGIHNAETLMLDPLNKDIYIVSRSLSSSKVYRAPYPQSTTDTLLLEYKITLDSTRYTGGDISPSGFEILIKTYFNIFYWYREPEQELWEALAVEPIIVPYIWESQGEAVGCEPKEFGGYYTISEERLAIPAHLYFYPRLDSTTFVADYNTIALVYVLNQNYPNPFNNFTVIYYSIPEEGFVILKVYNLLGKELAVLLNEEKQTGNYEVSFDATGLPSGIYFYRLQAGNYIETKKMVLMK